MPIIPISKKRFDFVKSSPFILLHLGAVVGLFLFPPTLPLVALCLGSYFVRMFAITAGYHRYFSHKSYQLGRFSQFVMATLGTSAVQKGPLWWAANHRHHHRFSDAKEDIHSPVQDGFWWSHIGWVLSNAFDETRWELIPDLKKFPELVWLNKYHLAPGLALGGLFYAVGGMPYFVWGWVISTVVLFHGTATINSLSHVFGTRRYQTTDDSRNNPLLALITLGEGWHNNHHCYMASTKQGFFWWEIDISYYVLKTLSIVGIVRGIKLPPLERLEKMRIKTNVKTNQISPAPSQTLPSFEQALPPFDRYAQQVERLAQRAHHYSAP